MAYYGDNVPFAWVAMTSINTASINDSYGVSSVSRIQNGTHQINFSASVHAENMEQNITAPDS